MRFVEKVPTAEEDQETMEIHQFESLHQLHCWFADNYYYTNCGCCCWWWPMCSCYTIRKQRRIKPFPLLNRHHQLYVFNVAMVLINLNLPAGTASMYTITTPSFLPLPILIDVLPAVHGNCTIIFQMPNELLLLWLYCHCSSSQPIPPNDIINCNNRHHHHGLH